MLRWVWLELSWNYLFLWRFPCLPALKCTRGLVCCRQISCRPICTATQQELCWTANKNWYSYILNPFGLFRKSTKSHVKFFFLSHFFSCPLPVLIWWWYWAHSQPRCKKVWPRWIDEVFCLDCQSYCLVGCWKNVEIVVNRDDFRLPGAGLSDGLTWTSSHLDSPHPPCFALMMIAEAGLHWNWRNRF